MMKPPLRDRERQPLESRSKLANVIAEMIGTVFVLLPIWIGNVVARLFQVRTFCRTTDANVDQGKTQIAILTVAVMSFRTDGNVGERRGMRASTKSKGGLLDFNSHQTRHIALRC